MCSYYTTVSVIMCVCVVCVSCYVCYYVRACVCVCYYVCVCPTHQLVYTPGLVPLCTA